MRSFKTHIYEVDILELNKYILLGIIFVATSCSTLYWHNGYDESLHVITINTHNKALKLQNEVILEEICLHNKREFCHNYQVGNYISI